MASTSATLTTALETARGSTHSWCKVTGQSEKKGGRAVRKGDVWWGRDVEKEFGMSSSFTFLHHVFLFLSFVVAFACTSIFFLF